LLEAGFRAVIAPSFGDIFKSNSFRSGLLPIELPQPAVRQLIDLAIEDPGVEVTVDLEAQVVSVGEGSRGAPAGLLLRFSTDPFFRECLLNGWDEIALTLRQEADIARFEGTRPAWLPAIRDHTA